MSLITAHRILIATAIAFFAFYGVWEIVGYRGGGEAAALWRGVVALAVAVAFAVYFPSIKKRYRRRTTRSASPL
jgi:hypothetical protein